MTLNPKSLDQERIAIQCRGKQSESLFIQVLYELILGTSISLRISRTSLHEFLTFLLLKLANFCAVLKRNRVHFIVNPLTTNGVTIIKQPVN